MQVHMVKAEYKHLADCKIALVESKLGEVYFPEEEKAVNALNDGLSKGEIFIALNNENECLGFIWFIMNGAFHSYPHLHIVAVKKEFRNLGIGKKLINFFEEATSENKTKLFLVVADFNPDAKRLYQNIGYKEVGIIPNLYKQGVTEFLMMKEL
jgi:ribosomal protein S18 acetylase RimI-like enzyme